MGSHFGSFELLRRLGAGATAEVFLASGPNPADADLVALKIVLPHLAEDAALRESLVKEARLCERIQHKHVARIYGVGEQDGRPYLAMEYVRGWTVSHVLKKLRETGERFTLDQACSIARDAALGLHHAHELLSESGKSLGLVHRDVSPQNLILGHDGRVKVVDFGLAKATRAVQDGTGQIKGKIAYMPPEQIEGGKLDRRVDVFALGAVLFELITGERLYPGRSEAEILQQAVILPPPDLRRLLPKVPPALVETLEKAIARDLKARTANALVFSHALKGFITPETAAALSRRVELLFDPDAVVDDERTAVDPKPPARPPPEPPPARERPRVSGEKPRASGEKRRGPEEKARPSEERVARAAAEERSRPSGERASRAAAEERSRPSEERPRQSGEKRRPVDPEARGSRPRKGYAEPAAGREAPVPSRGRSVETARPLEPLPRELQRAGLRPTSMPLPAKPELTNGGEERWGDATAARILLARPGGGMRRLGLALLAVALTFALGGLAYLALTRVKPLAPGSATKPIDPDGPSADTPVPGAMQPLGGKKERPKKVRREVEILPGIPESEREPARDAAPRSDRAPAGAKP